MDKKHAQKIFLITALLAVCSIAARAEITTKNTSQYIGNGRWKWTVFLQGADEILDRIDHVEYTLHKTFKNPIRKSFDRENGFALSSSGWGTFRIKLTLFHKNNTQSVMHHKLVFKETKAVQPYQLKTTNWSRQIEQGWWEWGIQLTGPADELNQVRCVEYTLHKSFPNPVRTICDPSTHFQIKARGWGTFTIPVKVILKNKSILRLEHQLNFQ